MTQATIRPGSCALCEAMCGLRITASGDRVIDIRGDEDDRLRSPVRRTAGGRREITWDEAFDLAFGANPAVSNGSLMTASGMGRRIRALPARTETARLGAGHHSIRPGADAACYGRMGVSTQRHGTLCRWAVQLLDILTGDLDRPGGTLFTRPAVDPIRTGEPGLLTDPAGVDQVGGTAVLSAVPVTVEPERSPAEGTGDEHTQGAGGRRRHRGHRRGGDARPDPPRGGRAGRAAAGEHQQLLPHPPGAARRGAGADAGAG
ncbi:hypothetical protein C1I98_05465 [Spongiactinospora gelatinilytica]|uniref:4Fe-4S Mo/W bis-MGD-type domain-containing protein n=1 Tax=Spongiactinospora gelatinilytica TaxID=2666298 RepID=A0A2W2H090_9ACTN|nr:hypothetical protein [Spongiactinospora gelatinilytica]PZG53343.1 hypothetical protein C1I98_05465 [Spongiactinospora gelatinilytica]